MWSQAVPIESAHVEDPPHIEALEQGDLFAGCAEDVPGRGPKPQHNIPEHIKVPLRLRADAREFVLTAQVGMCPFHTGVRVLTTRWEHAVVPGVQKCCGEEAGG